MTNADKFKKMSIDEMAEIIACCPYVTEYPRPCEVSDVNCIECSLQWLNQEVEEPKPEPMKPKRSPLPKPFDMDNLEGQLQSMSIKAIVQNVLACGSKINKIIDVLKEADDA